jgi:zeta-carotene desaturase
VDNGQHVLFGCYHETFRFLRRIGAEGNIRLQDRLAVDIIDRSGQQSRLACLPLPSPFHLIAGVVAWKALGWRDRIAAVRMGAAISRSRQELPPRGDTVREWLNRHSQTPRLIELLWEPLALAALNQPIDTASAAPFAAALRPMFGGGPRGAALGLPTKPLDDVYAGPARSYIERRGGLVRLSSPATIRGHHVHIRDERLAAPVIVCAVPWHALSGAFPEPPGVLGRVLDAADHTAASPIVTVNLWFDRAVMNQSLVGLPGRTLQWVFDKRAVFGEGASHLSLISSGAEAVVARSNQQLIDLALTEVTEALPAARSASLVRGVVVREKKATFSVAPGQPTRPLTETGVPGLLLAGDWIDTGLPATIEGAVTSGHWAADAATRQSVNPSARQ